MDFEKLDKELEKKIEEIAKKFDKRLKELIKEFSVQGGLEVNSKLTQLSKEILKELKNAGISDLYIYMSAILENITTNNVDYYSKLSGAKDAIMKSDSAKFVSDTLKKNLIGSGLETILAEKISNSIKPYILSGADFKTTSDILSKTIPKEISRYTNQITKGAFSVYDGAIQNTLKQKYNPKKGKYIGGLIESSRPFCIHMKDKYGSRDITIDDLQKDLNEYCPKGIPSDTVIEIKGKKVKKGAGMIEGTTVANFDINKGGATNNCYHEWRWIFE
jgi:hypothetical protein